MPSLSLRDLPLIALVLVILVLPGCATTPATSLHPETAAATPSEPSIATSAEPLKPGITTAPTRVTRPTLTQELLPADTTPPPVITGLVAGNAYDKRVNLWWDKSTATDFDHYNIYLNETEMVDATGLQAVQQIKDIATCSYQVTGLDDGTRHYFAVTAVDDSGNEGKNVTGVSATPTPMPRGTKDPNLIVDIYQPDKVWAGTTLLTLNHDYQRRRIVEVNMLGEVVWEYIVPQEGFIEAELLANNNILYTVGHGTGIFEINRNGDVVWSYLTSKVDHDADRLPSGNTLFVFGFGDQKTDAQVTEVNANGEIVWEWYAKDHFDIPPYDSIYDDGWTHVNAVSRLPNGNTLISLRNFHIIVEVAPQGEVVGAYGEGILCSQHDPAALEDGNILVANTAGLPAFRVVELDRETGEVVWKYMFPDKATDDINKPVRDANRLPNGNTLITGSTQVTEVTPQGEVVWRLNLQGVTLPDPASGFYKGDRISTDE